MEFRPLSQCRSDLNFKPQKAWPSHLPVYCFENQRLCGFERAKEGAAIELKAPLEEVLFQLHPTLSFREVGGLYLCLQDTDLKWNPEYLFRQWGFAFGESLLKMIELIREWPIEFQIYASEKAFSPRDLEPLSLGQSMDEELIHLANSRASKSEAVQLIELIVDLKMLGRFTDLDWERRASELIEVLRAIRFPKRTAKQNESRRRAKKLSWPKGMRWSWRTQSDQNTLEMHVTAQSLTELNRLTQQLEKVVEQANSDEGNNPWQ